jgi:hypothetical protein
MKVAKKTIKESTLPQLHLCLTPENQLDIVQHFNHVKEVYNLRPLHSPVLCLIVARTLT